MKRRFNLYLLSVLAMCACMLMIHAQTAAGQALSYTFQNLSTRQGLCSNYVKGIAEDHRGCIWVATEAGLARFDGNNFSTYTKSSSQICSNELNDVFFHSATRHLWIASQRDGISVFDVNAQQVVNHYTTDNGLLTNDVTHLGPAADGGIWITHYHVGVEHFNPKSGKFTQLYDKTIKGFSNLQSWCALDDGKGNLYVGHHGGGMSIVNLKTHSLQRFAYNEAQVPNGGIPGATVYALFRDNKDRIWVGTSQGLALFNPQNGKFRTFRHNAALPGSLLANQVMSIGQTRSGDIWVCTDMGGVSILPANVLPADGAFVNIQPSPSASGLSSPNAYHFFEDSHGNIWIGTYRGGIDVASHIQPLFDTLPYAALNFSTLCYKPVWALCTDPAGNVWLGGEEELCCITPTGHTSSQSLSALGQNVHVSSMLRDASGTLWLGIYHRGVAVYNTASGALSPLSMPRANLNVRCFHEQSGKIWIGTESGIFTCANGEVTEAENINKQLDDRIIQSLLTDRLGQLWVGTFGRGLYVFAANGRLLAHLENGNGLQSNAINHLLLDSRGTVWAATRKGAAHFTDVRRPKQVTLIGNDKGLAESHIHALAEDAEGNIWMSTNACIARLSIRTGQIENFTSRYGVTSGDFVNGAVAKNAQGDIYFGSLSGVSHLNPKRFNGLPKLATLQITGLQAFGAMAENSENATFLPLDKPEVRIPYNANTLRVTFNITDIALNHLTEYAYSVREFDDNKWYDTQGDNHVTFRDLAPGTYNIAIRARLAGQPWSPKVAMLRIVVTPPFWLAWYAKLLYAALFVLAVVWLMRSYKHKTDLEGKLRVEHHRHQNDIELNQERLRFYTNITHELRTPLTLIVGPLDDLSTDTGVPDAVQRKLSTIRRSAGRLLGLVNELLEFRKTETQNRKLRVVRDDISREVSEIALHFKELNKHAEVKITTTIEEGDYVQWFDPEIIRIVIDNFMSNALKYTPQGEVNISLCHETKTLAPPSDSDASSVSVRHTIIRVCDTGYGIPADSLTHIFDRYYQADGPHQVTGSGIGLALVKSVAELHHAEVSAANGENGGAVFSFSMLTDETYEGAERLEEAAQSPASAPTATDGDTAEAATSDEAENAAQQSTILVVEDNADLRTYIHDSLSAEFHVLQAADGQEGLNLAKEHTPDMVITDVMMPVMDGYELCRKLKSDVDTSHIPVVLLTAKDLMQDKAEGYAAGADSYLTKPFSSRLLLSRIHNLLSVRRQLAEAIAQRMGIPQNVAPATAEVPTGSLPAGPVIAVHVADIAEASSSGPQLSKMDMEFLKKLEAFILAHLDQEKLDVGYIASEMCMSHSTLYRKIKALIGISVNEYVRRIRLRQAAEMLLQRDITIAEIADRTGFSTSSYFRQCFKDAYGITPSEYAARVTERLS